MKYTKTKWKISMADYKIYTIDDENNYNILATVNPIKNDWGQADANAELIAAAPEMYEALKNVTEFMSGTNLKNLEILKDLKKLLKQIDN